MLFDIYCTQGYTNFPHFEYILTQLWFSRRSFYFSSIPILIYPLLIRASGANISLNTVCYITLDLKERWFHNFYILEESAFLVWLCYIHFHLSKKNSVLSLFCIQHCFPYLTELRTVWPWGLVYPQDVILYLEFRAPKPGRKQARHSAGGVKLSDVYRLPPL